MNKILDIFNKYVRLSFTNPILEKRFQEDYLKEFLPQNILVSKITIFLYLSYVSLNYFFVTNNELLLLTLVSLVGISGTFGLLILSKTKFIQKHTNSVLLITAMLVSISPIFYFVLTENNRILFQVAILLPIIGIFTMLGISFSLASFTFFAVMMGFIILSMITDLNSYDYFIGMSVLLSGGTVSGLASYFMERAQRKLFLSNTSNTEFKFIIENSQDSIAIFDIDEMRYLYVNKTAATCNDSMQKGVVGKTLEEFHPEFTKDVRDAIKRKLDREGIFSDTSKLYSTLKKASYYAHMVIQYGYYKGQKVIITFSSDVTQEKEAELAMQHMAFHDPLTGLYNRNKFDEASQVQISLSARYKNKVSLVLCDIDYFKNFNDKYGHSVGDEVLKQVASTINDVVRESDMVARWGGEEFAVLFPNTSKHEAVIVAEKIRQEIESINLKGMDNITISCGVAQLELDETDTHWFNRVDEALYKAKEAGRNRVCTN